MRQCKACGETKLESEFMGSRRTCTRCLGKKRRAELASRPKPEVERTRYPGAEIEPCRAVVGWGFK